ncbi:MAG: hypothetical protein HZA15_07810 [Nitrospirae bacterium]|nr:hypothetical protein [Nitrospirota bacterium]
MGEILYLETTAAIDAAFKSFPELLSLIKSSEKSISSQYVKMEIKRGFLYNLVLLHNKAVECSSFAQVQQFAANLASSPKRYYLGAVLDTLRVYFEKIDSQRPDDLKKKYGNIHLGDIHRKQMIYFLRSWIRMFLPKIDKMVDELINPMKCFVDLKSPVLNGELFDNKPSRCSQSGFECEIQKFFQNNEDGFKVILNNLRKLHGTGKDDETKKREAALNFIIKKRIHRTSMKFSNKSQDEIKCWECGDAIHAVLAPKGASVVNRNGRHYDQICEAIDRKSLVYKSPKV